MRLYAKNLGFHLCDKYLKRISNCEQFSSFGGHGVVVSHRVGEAIHCESEADIFAALGIPYVNPEKRGSFIFPNRRRLVGAAVDRTIDINTKQDA
jgi:hypothetical protein